MGLRTWRLAPAAGRRVSRDLQYCHKADPRRLWAASQFNRRITAPGTRFFYASIEPDVLGAVLRYAVDKSASDYLREKVWEPIGAEADATWLIDSDGFEVAHGFFNAVLRD